jgi:hypothetical protein
MPSLELNPMPPKEAIDFFRKKGYKVDYFDSNRDATTEQHKNAFMVAKMMEIDLLEGVREQVDKSIAEGMSFPEFRKNLETTLTDKGWWGRKVMTDPVTGLDKVVQLGSVSRLKKIYETNIRHTHADGQWQRIQEYKEVFQYLVYDANNSQVPRIEHSEYNRLCLKADDVFWQSHYPPQGYGCKCRVYAVTENQMKKDSSLSFNPPNEEYISTTELRNKSVAICSNEDKVLKSLIIPKNVMIDYYYAPNFSQRIFDALKLRNYKGFTDEITLLLIRFPMVKRTEKISKMSINYENLTLFGKELLSSLLSSDKSFTSVVHNSGFGEISKTVKFWMSRYNISNDKFAKVFANTQMLPQTEWSDIEVKLSVLLKYTTNERYQINDWKLITDLPQKDRIRNEIYIEVLAKNLGLSRYLNLKESK